MKIEAEIITIVDGKLERIKIDDITYRVLPVIPFGKPVLAKTRKRRRRRTPSDMLGYDKTYGKWVSKDDAKKVTNAINHVELGYEPTMKQIARLTDISKTQATIIVHYLRKTGKVIIKSQRNQIPIYKVLD